MSLKKKKKKKKTPVDFDADAGASAPTDATADESAEIPQSEEVAPAATEDVADDLVRLL